MVDSESSTAIQNITEFDKYMNFLKLQYATNREPIGFKIENASSFPTVKRINKNFEEFTPGPEFFHNHELFQWPKCILTPAGIPTFSELLNGYNTDGTHLDFTGASGNVMARIQNPQYRYLYEEENDTQFYLFAPYDSGHVYFSYHPNAYSGGGKLNKYFYLACYEGSMGVDTSGNKILKSVSGEQPWTGGQIRSIPFSNGTTEFTIGETLAGATSGVTGDVIAYHKTSGEWAGTAAGTAYVKNPGVDCSAVGQQFQTSESITRSTGSAIVSATSTAMSLNINDALTYASNIGIGWTIDYIWSNALVRCLFFTQYGTRNSQSIIGRGIDSIGIGNGYIGKITGSDDIDTRLDAWGTGTGDGIDGLVAVSYNNLQNLQGNVSKLVAGINFINDGTYHVTNRDGTGVLVGALPEMSYETGQGVPLNDGYISKIQTDELGALALIPKAADGSDTTLFCDYFRYPRFNPSIMASGGNYNDGVCDGVNAINAWVAVADSAKSLGVRLRYIPQS